MDKNNLVSPKLAKKIIKESRTLHFLFKFKKMLNYQDEQHIISDFLMNSFAAFKYQHMKEEKISLLFSDENVLNSDLYQKLLYCLALEDNPKIKELLTKVMQEFNRVLDTQLLEEEWGIFKYIEGDGLYLESK